MLVKKTFFISFRQRELSVDGRLGWMIAGVGSCEGCGQEDAPLAINAVEIEEVRDGETQVVLDPSSKIVKELEKELGAMLKIGKRLCPDCLPKIPEEIPER